MLPWKRAAAGRRRIKDAEQAASEAGHQADQAAEERKRAEAQALSERRWLRPRLLAAGDADRIAAAIERQLGRSG
jgi:hypothetical protein